MFLSKMFGQGLLLPKTLPTVLTTESLLAFMNCLMSLESGARDKALSAALPGTDVFALVGVDGFDVLFQVLILDVVLVACIVRTFEGPGVGVRIEMISKSGRSIEGFRASRPGTSKSFEI